MKRGIAALMFLAVSGVSISLAMDDRAPDIGDSNFTVCTEDKRYCAEVGRVAQLQHPWRAYTRLTVWEEREGQQRRELWAKEYRSDGYAGGLLTPDGRIFVHVSSWYSPDTVIWIDSSEGRIEIPGRDFPYHHTRVHQAVTQEPWLASGSSPYELVGSERLKIRTIDGRTHYVGLTDGIVKSEKPSDSAP